MFLSLMALMTILKDFTCVTEMQKKKKLQLLLPGSLTKFRKITCQWYFLFFYENKIYDISWLCFYIYASGAFLCTLFCQFHSDNI